MTAGVTIATVLQGGPRDGEIPQCVYDPGPDPDGLDSGMRPVPPPVHRQMVIDHATRVVDEAFYEYDHTEVLPDHVRWVYRYATSVPIYPPSPETQAALDKLASMLSTRRGR